MSYANFGLRLGLYDKEYTRTLEYDNLSFHRPLGEPTASYWHRPSADHLAYDPQKPKVSILKFPAL